MDPWVVDDPLFEIDEAGDTDLFAFRHGALFCIFQHSVNLFLCAQLSFCDDLLDKCINNLPYVKAWIVGIESDKLAA